MILLKFGKIEQMQSLLKHGQIYFNTIDYFKNHESPFRGDSYEGITALYQPKDIKLSIAGRIIKDFAGPISIKSPQISDRQFSHIFCLSLLKKGTPFASETEIIDDRMKDFGDSLLVIYNVKLFLNRMEKALSEVDYVYDYHGKEVLYVPHDEYSGKMDIFMKTSPYKWQNEFRLAVNAPLKKDSFSLNIGNLEDITEIIHMQNFKNLIIPNGEKNNLVFS